MGVYDERLSRLRVAMIDAQIGAVILTPGANMRYLAGFSEEGFERLLCLVVPLDSDCVLVAPSVNAEQAKANPAGIADVRVWDDRSGWEGLVGLLAEERELKAARIGVDDGMAARFLLPLLAMLGGAEFCSARDALSGLRMRKDPAELDALARAAIVTDAAYLAGRDACRPGATERQVALAIENAIAERGAALSFETIVAAGENSALPHHRPGSRALAKGDSVTLDLGARVDGYCGDITRVVSVGPPSAEAAVLYDIVLRAQQAGVAAVRPGIAAEAVDEAARSVIDAAGFGDAFIHRAGHGIGLDDHELPNIVAGNSHLLREGECFSIEPGIYLAGRFGIRLENIVAVAGGGARVLNAPIPEHMEQSGD